METLEVLEYSRRRRYSWLRARRKCYEFPALLQQPLRQWFHAWKTRQFQHVIFANETNTNRQGVGPTNRKWIIEGSWRDQKHCPGTFKNTCVYGSISRIGLRISIQFVIHPQTGLWSGLWTGLGLNWIVKWIMNWIGVELDCKLDWNWIVNWIVFEVDWELDCKLDCVYTGLGAGLQTVLCASR